MTCYECERKGGSERKRRACETNRERMKIRESERVRYADKEGERD